MPALLWCVESVMHGYLQAAARWCAEMSEFLSALQFLIKAGLWMKGAAWKIVLPVRMYCARLK